MTLRTRKPLHRWHEVEGRFNEAAAMTLRTQDEFVAVGTEIYRFNEAAAMTLRTLLQWK